MDFLMESGFMHWMSERMSFTNWVKADFHETSRITLKFSASPREISARRGEFALRQLLSRLTLDIRACSLIYSHVFAFLCGSKSMVNQIETIVI